MCLKRNLQPRQVREQVLSPHLSLPLFPYPSSLIPARVTQPGGPPLFLLRLKLPSVSIWQHTFLSWVLRDDNSWRHGPKIPPCSMGPPSSRNKDSYWLSTNHAAVLECHSRPEVSSFLLNLTFIGIHCSTRRGEASIHPEVGGPQVKVRTLPSKPGLVAIQRLFLECTHLTPSYISYFKICPPPPQALTDVLCPWYLSM